MYKTIMLPLVFYGCETWCLTLRDEDGLKVFENKVLRGTFGPKGYGIIGGWRKLHNEELHYSYSSPNMTIKEDEMGRACSMHGIRVLHIGFFLKARRKRPSMKT
jgi:hypothetical protein